MFIESFKVTGGAVFQIFLLAAIGFFLVKIKFLGDEGLDALSRLTMDVTLPILIFYQLVKDFTFAKYPGWWALPLISIALTAVGLLFGFLFSFFITGRQHKMQFLSLVTFQNSGYLPLALVAALLTGEQLGTMFIYLFLLLTGFNLVMFSLGVYMLSFQKDKKFEPASLLSAPVVATVISLVFIVLGLNKFMPEAVMKPLQLTGQCTLPLAMLVVGGNLAQINLKRIDTRSMSLALLAKMVVLPFIGLWFILTFQVPYLIGLLVLIQLAMPSAVTLSVIIRNYKKEDLLISQGILLSHIMSIITIPLFLILYFSLVVIK